MVKATTATIPDSLDLEMRRGVIIVAVLSQLQDEQYGYSLKKALTEKGLDVDEGTLYPLLRRLETQGLLDSNWKVEDARPRRYYRLNANGRRVFAALTANWFGLVQVMDRLLK